MTRRGRTGRAGAAGAARLGRLAVVAAVLLVPAGAGAEEARSSALSRLPRQGFPDSVLGSLRTALEVYEEVRAELAADRLEGVPAAASRLAGALRRAFEGGAGLAGPIPGVIEETARAAGSMAAAEDLAAARAAFGDVSRLLLLLGDSDPRLTEGRHVFSCPMATTFDRWIQPAEALGNPYMGSAMLTCGTPVEWSAPAPSPAEESSSHAREAGSPGAQEDAGAEPVFRPGIPGLKMVDVRDHRFLWREIDVLQTWERADRISIAEYRSKVIEKTAHFLGLGEAAAEDFAAAASEAVAALRESFFQSGPAGENPGGAEARFPSDLRAAETRLTSLLGEEPRHRLFAPECKKWLLRLAFGPSEAKEASEG